ncbi:hypothetical protein LIA77_10195 [Sarocladium implicatum]|nr:hypothetical protein LIA77_10195 [Sarocladium implicatum]
MVDDESDWYDDDLLEEPPKPTTDTGQAFSPLMKYLDDLQVQANARGEKVQIPPPGPAVKMASSIVETFRKTRLEQQARKAQAKETTLRPIREREEKEYEDMLYEAVGEALEERDRKLKTKEYMRERAKRIKMMRFPDGRLRYAGRPIEYAGYAPPWILDMWAWKMIEDTYWRGELGWKVGKETWEEYIYHVTKWQQQVFDTYEKWIREHWKLKRYPVWVDESATYRVKDRRRAYRDEMLNKVTYHSVGIPHYHLLNPPRFIPRPPKKHQIEPVVCFQCEEKGLPKRCVLKTGGCSRCQRTGEECMSLYIFDIEDARDGVRDEEDIRAWFVPGFTIKGFEGDDEETKERITKEAQRRKRWFEVGRFKRTEYVGGKFGFVKRNVKEETWALPAWERDENGKIIPART